MDLLRTAMAMKDWLVEHRRYLHENPEVHHVLPKTVNHVKRALEAMGLEPCDMGQSGLVADIKGDAPGKTFLLRADMDALPIVEETTLPFKSLNENMHACGHDLHTTMLLGAAKLLKDRRHLLHGTVRLMFQPAEETLTGAADMIDAGVLINPPVDGAMMMHVFALPDTKSGLVFTLTDGAASASCDTFKISIKGKGGHGAMPHLSVDPLIAMSHIHLALCAIHSREISADAFLVITPCMMHGGSSPNIIPDTAIMQGTIRTFDSDTRAYAKKRLETIAISTGKTHGCTVTVEFIKACPSLINDPNLNASIKRHTQALLGEAAVRDGKEIEALKHGRISGSEDFALISARVPSTILILAANLPNEDNKRYGMHHPKVMFDEDAMPIGAAVYANAAIKWLDENQS